MPFSLNPQSNQAVVSQFNETHQYLISQKNNFDQAVAGLSGANSEATRALKAIVAQEVTPRLTNMLNIFDSFGQSMDAGLKATLEAELQGGDTVGQFRNRIAY